MTTKYNLVIVDDHPLLLTGIKSLVSTAGYNVVGEFNNGKDAIQFIEQNQVHLVITDINMPLLNGIELCRLVKALHKDIKVMILSMYDHLTAIKEALGAEADGYILKETEQKEFLMAIQKILDGGIYFSQAIIPILYNQYQKEKKQIIEIAALTSREKEILQLIAQELTSEEISAKLFISKKTVDNHRAHLLVKTNSKSTIGLVKFAIKNNLIQL